MKAQVYCNESNAREGGLDFYLKVGNESYYLFNQRWRTDVKNFFSAGVSVDRALKQNTRRASICVQRVAEKLPSYIHYIEQEYGLIILEKTKKKAPQYA